MILTRLKMFNLLSRRTSLLRRALSSSNQDPASPELLSQIKELGTQAAVDALWLNGYPQCQICGSRALTEGMKTVGNAVTVRSDLDCFVHSNTNARTTGEIRTASPGSPSGQA